MFMLSKIKKKKKKKRKKLREFGKCNLLIYKRSKKYFCYNCKYIEVKTIKV